jgi:hypothetical protein
MTCGHCGGEFVADPGSLRSDSAGGLRCTPPVDPTASARVIVDLAASARVSPTQRS